MASFRGFPLRREGLSLPSLPLGSFPQTVSTRLEIHRAPKGEAFLNDSVEERCHANFISFIFSGREK